jgi:hypothetical protein
MPASAVETAPAALGSALADVQAAYPAAQMQKGTSEVALRLTEVEYQGLHWETVDFVFDQAQRLSAVRFSTRTESMAKVQKLVMAQMEAPAFGVQLTSGARGDAFQIKLCTSDAGVTVTVERESFPI